MDVSDLTPEEAMKLVAKLLDHIIRQEDYDLGFEDSGGHMPKILLGKTVDPEDYPVTLGYVDLDDGVEYREGDPDDV